MNVKSLPVVLAVSIVLVLLVLFVILRFNVLGRFFSSGAPTLPGTGQVTLEYWGMFEPEEAMQVLINEYQRNNPNIRINYTQRRESDLTSYRATLLNRITNRSGPDIFRMHVTWANQYAGVLSPSRNISTNEFRQRFYQSAQLNCINPSGSVICVPLMYDGLVLLYNQDMFSSIGIRTPGTWDEVREAALRLTIRGDRDSIVRSGIAVGTADNVDYASDILALMFHQSKVVVPDGLDTDAAAAALTFYTNFARVDNVWDSSMPNSTLAFATERTAMTFAKTEDMLEILRLNPTIRMGVLPVPQLPNISGGTTSETLASYWVEGVSAYSSDDEQQAAWDFLRWLSEPDQQKRLFNTVSQYRRFGYAYSDRNLAEEIQSNNYLANVVNQAEFGIVSFLSSKSGNDVRAQLMRTAISRMFERTEPLRILIDTKEEYMSTNSLR